MKNTLKITSGIIIFFIIVTLLIVLSTCIKNGIQNILMVKNYIKEIENDTNELSNNEYTFQTIEKVPPPLVIEKPSVGANFGTLKIPSINIELPMFYGTTSDLLKNGVGHDNSSYLPGEGGSVILMGHNFKQFLANLPNANIGDEIQLITNYGEFSYTIYDAKIVKETQVDEVPVQKDEELVMIYTCWPINNVTHANERYVVYAK